MTVADWLKSLSGADEGSKAIDVVANIEGTYPVISPANLFDIEITNEDLECNLDTIHLLSDFNTVNLDSDLTTSILSADITQANLDGDLK